MDVNKYHERQARYILTLTPDQDNQYNWQTSWDECTGYEEGNFYYIEFRKKGYLVRKLRFTKEQGYKIRIKNNLWLYNSVLNRSGLAAKVWDDDIPNKLRRRLELKGEYNSFTDEERQKIKNALREFYKETMKAME